MVVITMYKCENCDKMEQSKLTGEVPNGWFKLHMAGELYSFPQWGDGTYFNGQTTLEFSMCSEQCRLTWLEQHT